MLLPDGMSQNNMHILRLEAWVEKRQTKRFVGQHFAGGVSAASMLVSATSSNAILGGQQLAQAVDVSIATCPL